MSSQYTNSFKISLYVTDRFNSARQGQNVMSKLRTKRMLALDALKGASIIAVVLYHFDGNMLPFGYLGVDIFFVVGGFLLIQQLNGQLEDGKFSYKNYIYRKFARLWPLCMLAIILSLIVGYFTMLPNDYENLAESAVASTVFSNNILQCITTKNYWDIVNSFKPLMHLWYVGVLMQAYILLPVLYCLTTRLSKDMKKAMYVTTLTITIVSLMLFTVPIFTSAWKFYYLPFRLFEITAGGLVALDTLGLHIKLKNILAPACSILLLLILGARKPIFNASIMLVSTVVLTMVFIESNRGTESYSDTALSFLGHIGKRSYSIYIWHQVLFAFYFYFVSADHSLYDLVVLLTLAAIVCVLSFRYIEQPLANVIPNLDRRSMLASSSIVALLTIAVSLSIYSNAGVVRDVPELDIIAQDAHRGMHSEYCDRVYSWNRPFNESDSTKVLVIGNSFARDWANVIYEYNSDLDISYIYYNPGDEIVEDGRVEQADYVFYVQGLSYGLVPQYIEQLCNSAELYIVGNKNYGKSNGIVYAKRFSEGYFDQSVTYDLKLQTDVSANKSIWGSQFIDIMEPLLVSEGRIRVFTDDHKFISQDCRHLTHAGAVYYSRILDLAFLNNEA